MLFEILDLSIVLLLIRLVNGQVIKPGKCPQIDGVRNLNFEKMSGLWYYKQHFKDVFDDSLICSKEYVVSDGNVLRSTYKAFNETTMEKIVVHITYKLKEDSGAAEFVEEFSMFNGKTFTIQSKIIAVDYDNYYLIWTCEEDENNSYRYLWIQTRSIALPENIQNQITEIMNFYNLEPSNLEDTKFENCNEELF